MQPLEYQEPHPSAREKQSLSPEAAIYVPWSHDRVVFGGKIVKAMENLYKTFVKDSAWMAILGSQMPVGITPFIFFKHINPLGRIMI